MRAKVTTSAASLAVPVGLFAWRKLYLALLNQRVRQIADLNHYRDRLQAVYSELLSQANELDQNSKYASADLPENWSKRLGIICEELVRLGEMLPLIEDLLERKKVKSSRTGLLQSCRMASKISGELKLITGEQPKLLDDKSREYKVHEIPLSEQKD